jgi:hypothetical protein
MIGYHVIKHWSTTQGVVALSSAEAELYGIVKGAVQGIGLCSIAGDLGDKLDMELYTDSSAAMGVCKRKGIGRVRHLDTNLLWVQAKMRDGTLNITKVLGDNNPADLMTKHLENTTMTRHVAYINCSYEEGRAESAPRIKTITKPIRGTRLIYVCRDQI